MKTTRDDVRSDVMDFEQISSRDLARAGGKNASLGELFRALKPKGVGVLDGFATTLRIAAAELKLTGGATR
jgi:pyruvate,water dikinase